MNNSSQPLRCRLRYPHPSQSLDGTRSLGNLIQDARGKPVHIIFVHGIRATEPDNSKAFQEELCKHVVGCRDLPTASRQYINLGDEIPPARVVGEEVWRTHKEWKASRPLVDRRIYKSRTGATIIVDELNWWPLVFPLKCRFLLLPEIDLSGADDINFKYCVMNDEPYFPWTNETEIRDRVDHKSPRSGGALANSFLKQQVMNWGLADAVTALGPMKAYLQETVDKAFDYSDAGDAEAGSPEDQDFVVVAESLGAFIVMDAFNAPDG